MWEDDLMTTPDRVYAEVPPVAPEAPPVAPSGLPAAPADPGARYRNLASAVAVFLGGYLLVLALSGQLASFLTGQFGNRPGFIALLMGQLVFAALVVVAGFFLSTASAGRKLVASAIVAVVVVVELLLQVALLGGVIGGGIALPMTLANPYFMTVVAVGVGWLIVRGAKLGWLALLLAVVLIPLPLAFANGVIDFQFAGVIQLLVSAIVGVVIVAGGRPLRG